MGLKGRGVILLAVVRKVNAEVHKIVSAET
jgi:hypothetical protein